MPAVLDPKPAPAPTKFDDAVRATLDDTGRKIRTNDAITGGLVVAAIALAYAAGMVLLDRWLDLPAWVRQFSLAGLLAVVGAAGWYLVARPYRRQVNPRYVARQVEGTISDAKNAVINWVDLHDRDIPGSVRSALGQKAAAGLAESDPADAVASTRMAWAGGVVAVLVGVLAVLFLIFKSQFLSLLGRTFNPFSDKAIAARTDIELVSPTGDLTVTDGQQIGFAVRITGNIPAVGSPQQVRLKVRYAPDAEYDEYPMERGDTIRDYAYTAGRLVIQNGFWFRVAAGDNETPEYRATVRTRPMVQAWEAKYEYPEYLRLKPDTGREPRLDGFRGTRVALTVQTNRVVKSGTLTTEIGGLETPVTGQVVGDGKDSLRFDLTLQDRGTYTINFTSTEDEKSGPTVPYPIEVYVDQPPAVTVTKPNQDEIVLPTTGLLEVDAGITDDQGIAAAALKFKVAGGPAIAPKSFRDGKTFKRETDNSFPKELAYKDSVRLDALKTADGKPLALQPDTVLEYWVEATDNYSAKIGDTVSGPNVGKSKVQKVRLTKPEAEPMKRQEQQNQQQQRQEQRKGEEKQNNQQQDNKNQGEKRDPQQPQNRENNPGEKGQPDQQQPGGMGQNDPSGTKPPEQDPKAQPNPNQNPMGNGQGNDPKAQPPEQNPQDRDTQRKAEDLQNKIEERNNQAGEARDNGSPDRNKPDENPGRGKPGDKNQPGQNGATEGKEPPKGEPNDPKQGSGEGKGAGDVQQPNKAEDKPQPKPGEDPNGDPNAAPKQGPKPDEQEGAGQGKSSGPQPGQAEQPPPKPGEKMRESDGAGGKGSGEPKGDPNDPNQPKPKPGEKDGAKNAGQGKPGGDVNRGEQRKPEAGQQGDPSSQPGQDTDPAAKPAGTRDKAPPKEGTGKAEPKGTKPPPAEDKTPPKEGDPMKGGGEAGEGKGAGTEPDPKTDPKAKPVEKGGQKGSGQGQPGANPQDIKDAVKDLGSDDAAKRDAAKEKLDKTVGPDARKKAEEIANDMKSGDPKKQEDAKQKLDDIAKQAGKGGTGTGKPDKLTPEQKELADAAGDLNNPDPEKRKAAEKKLDEKIGKGEREKFQKEQKEFNDAAGDLNNPDAGKRNAAEKKLDQKIGKGEREKLQREQKEAIDKLDKADPKELAEAMKDLASNDKAKQDAAREKLDKMVGPDTRKQLEQLAKDANSDDPMKREQAKKAMDELTKKGEAGKPELTKEEKDELMKAARDLTNPDEAKRKEAEKKLDEKIGKERREEVQKRMKELDEQMAKAKQEANEREAQEWKPGGTPGKGPDGKPLEDNPENRLKASELQLKQFKDVKDDPAFLKKAGYSKEEYEKFLKGFEDMVARQRTDVEQAKADPNRQPGTDPKRNVSDGSGANTRLTGPQAVPGGPSAGGTGQAPPGFSEAHKRFIEEVLKGNKPK